MSWKLEKADREVSKCVGLGGCGAFQKEGNGVSLSWWESPPRSMTDLGRMMKISTFLRPPPISISNPEMLEQVTQE